MRNTLIKEVVNDKRDLHDNLDKPTIVAVIPGVITTTIGGVQYKNLIKMATHSPNDQKISRNLNSTNKFLK